MNWACPFFIQDRRIGSPCRKIETGNGCPKVAFPFSIRNMRLTVLQGRHLTIEGPINFVTNTGSFCQSRIAN